VAIIEARVRVAKNKLGDLVMDLAGKIPYATLAGINVVIPSAREITPANDVPAIINQTGPKLSKPQVKVIEALKEGCLNETAISEMSGVVRVKRVLNTLKKKKLVKGHNGSYTIT
jgi:hypothetical protein